MFNLAFSNLNCRASGATAIPSFGLLGFVLAVLLCLSSAQGQVYDWSNFAGKPGGLEMPMA